MNKMQIAHEYAMQLVASPDYNDDMSLVEFVDHVWKYADAMQAEADKRECKERPEVLKKEWQPDTYPEYEHGRDYPSDAWVTFNGEARLAISIKEDSLRKRPQ